MFSAEQCVDFDLGIKGLFNTEPKIVLMVFPQGAITIRTALIDESRAKRRCWGSLNLQFSRLAQLVCSSIQEPDADGFPEEVEEVVIPIVDEVAPAEVGGGEAEESGEKNNVGEDDEHEGEEGFVLLEVGLVAGNHPAGEEEVEEPGGTDDGEENFVVIEEVGSLRGEAGLIIA